MKASTLQSSSSKSITAKASQGKAMAPKATPASFEEVLSYQEYKPSASLAPYVECYWQLESDPSDTTQYRKEKVLPYAFPELIFCYGGQASIIYNKNHKQELPESFAMGQFEQYICLEYQGQLASFGVKFKPAGLYELFKVPMKELTNKAHSLAELSAGQAETVTTAVVKAASVQERIQAVEAFLIEQLSEKPSFLPYIEKAVNKIVETGGSVAVAELLDEFNICERQMERKFLERVGMSPKMLTRVMRINQAFRILKQKPSSSWIDITYQCGYFDQAHFIRDFKKFAGESPSSFFSRHSDFTTIFQAR